MTDSALAATGDALVANLCCDDKASTILGTRLLRLLAEGRPVPPARLAAALGLARREVERALQQRPSIEYDDQGNIIASGLSRVPTPHQFRINGHVLYTWCAIDTLMYPQVLQQSAQVTSRCPVTSRDVRLAVTPERIVDLDPADALVSVVVPEAAAVCCDVRSAFCNHVYYLHGPVAGATWRAAHPEATLLTVDEAFSLARRLVACRYGPAPR